MTRTELLSALREAREGSHKLNEHVVRFIERDKHFLPAGSPIYNIPDYTRSLDAALTLCVKGTLWAVGSMEEGPFARLCWPQPDGGYVGGYHEASAATAPLALCIAALEARG